MAWWEVKPSVARVETLLDGEGLAPPHLSQTALSAQERPRWPPRSRLRVGCPCSGTAASGERLSFPPAVGRCRSVVGITVVERIASYLFMVMSPVHGGMLSTFLWRTFLSPKGTQIRSPFTGDFIRPASDDDCYTHLLIKSAGARAAWHDDQCFSRTS